ncbi:MAG TPA: neutral/alkaline non-lysosomal ceramidase N-terminal domain-containing protein [Thermoguttaceae bacterium]|nr:neutral/alkaline non-lysosomal ceramidase N-terminal domain-containing protein [Thermoguttaceae bacterium]
MQSKNRTVSRRGFLATAAAACAAGTTFGPGRKARALADDSQGKAARLRAGAATRDVTPKPGVVLDGPIMQIGPVEAVHDRLNTRALVLDDGSERLAICTADCTMASRDVFDRAKQLVHEKTGLAADRMLFAGTHSHSAVRATGIGQGPLDKEYLELLAQGIAKAVCRAIDNLAPARIGWGVGQKPELVHNRRWLMKPGTIPPNPFGQEGEKVKMNPGRGSPDLVEPAGPVDPEVSVVSVQHADGRPLGVLANFGIHYCGGTKRREVSADYFGVFANRIGELLGAGDVDPPFVGILSNGTSGDISNGFDFRKPAPKKAPYQWMQEVGELVADEALRVIRGIEHRDDVSLAMRQTELELATRRPDEARLAWAREVWSKAEGKPRLSLPEIYAREAILLADFPPTVSLPLQALRIGELGIAAIPCEVFAETGLAIKQSSPLKPTFVIEIANAYHGYLPTPPQHAWGGYETWPARSSCLQIEAEPRIRETVLGLLDGVSRPT